VVHPVEDEQTAKQDPSYQQCDISHVDSPRSRELLRDLCAWQKTAEDIRHRPLTVAATGGNAETTAARHTEDRTNHHDHASPQVRNRAAPRSDIADG
jgi:hypothetical protein